MLTRAMIVGLGLAVAIVTCATTGSASARSRHPGGTNFSFSDGHVKFNHTAVRGKKEFADSWAGASVGAHGGGRRSKASIKKIDRDVVGID